MITFSEWQREFLGTATYQEQRELYQNYVNRVLDKMEKFPLYSRFVLETEGFPRYVTAALDETENFQFKPETPMTNVGLRVRVKEGNCSVGRQGRTLGPNVKVGTRWWTPVKWDSGVDAPDWFLTDGLEYRIDIWSDFEKK